MAENLNYKVTYSYCYSESVANCEKYGRLYTWSAAKEACPEGWHLPTNAEFETLLKAVGGSSVAGTMLKSKKGWYDGGHGIDEYGFNVLPAGGHSSSGNFSLAGECASFWSATENREYYAYGLGLCYYYENASMFSNGSDKRLAFSVRCLRGSN